MWDLPEGHNKNFAPPTLGNIKSQQGVRPPPLNYLGGGGQWHVPSTPPPRYASVLKTCKQTKYTSNRQRGKGILEYNMYRQQMLAGIIQFWTLLVEWFEWIKGCAKKNQTLDFFAHKLRCFQYFFMKIDIDALNCNTKLI